MIVPATTSSGLELLLRAPIHGDNPQQHDDPYVLSQAVPIVLSAPSLRGVGRHVKSAIELRLRAAWMDPENIRIVAVLADDPETIAGFIMGDPWVPRIDYVHTRGILRGQGVARLLVGLLGVGPEVPAAVTFDTADLSRPRASGPFPVGLIHSSRWRLTLTATRTSEAKGIK